MPEEKNKFFVDALRALFSRVKTTDTQPVKQSSEYAPISLFRQYLTNVPDWWTTLGTGYADTRLDKYDKYRYIDENLAEAEASLNVYADNIVSGTISGESSYNVYIEEDELPEKERKIVMDIVERTERNTGLKVYIWNVARNVVKFGDEWDEIVFAKSPIDQNIEIKKLKSLSPSQIFADVDDRGVFKDENYPYFQKIKDSTQQVKFDEWRIVHFKMGNEIYGSEYSIFARSAQRTARQLLWINELLVLARLSRAWQRIIHYIDTKGMSPMDALDYAKLYLRSMKQTDIVSQATGRISPMEAIPLPDEDMAIPVSEGAHQKVDVIGGDVSVTNIRDIEYLQNEFLMAMTMPKAYVSLEEGIGARATLTKIDIQFARQVRRRQQALIAGLKHIYSQAFYLANINPNDFKWEIEFPELATEDELIKWQIEQTKAQIAQTYISSLGALNSQWLYKEILGFDDDKIKKYAQQYFQNQGGQPGEPGSDYMQFSPQAAEAIKKDPIIREMLDSLTDLIRMRETRDKNLEDKIPIGLNKSGNSISKKEKGE